MAYSKFLHSGFWSVTNPFKKRLDSNFDDIDERLQHQLLGNVWEVTDVNEIENTISDAGVYYLADSLLTETIKAGEPQSVSTLPAIMAAESGGAIIDSDENYSPLGFDMSAIICIDGTAGNDVGVRVRLWDDSEASYFTVTEMEGTVANFSGPDDMAQLGVFGTFTADVDDRVEIWIANLTNTNNITLCDSTVLKIKGI
jgi:hypothetical protein